MKAVISNTFRQKLEHRLVKEGMTRHEAKQAVEDMLVFLAEANEGGKSAPGLSADAAWHAAILHTQEYIIFCERNFGHFMHHVPTWPPKPAAATCDMCNGNAACNTKAHGHVTAGAVKTGDCSPDPCTCTKGNCGLKVVAAAVTADCDKSECIPGGNCITKVATAECKGDCKPGGDCSCVPSVVERKTVAVGDCAPSGDCVPSIKLGMPVEMWK